MRVLVLNLGLWSFVLFCLSGCEDADQLPKEPVADENGSKNIVEPKCFAFTDSERVKVLSDDDERAARSEPTVLQDFSYSGYHRGEVAIAHVEGPVFKVNDFGGKANDALPDDEAVRAAIAAAAAAGGGVVLFERGRYVLGDRQRIEIQHDGIVLRGAGSGKDGTLIFQAQSMTHQELKSDLEYFKINFRPEDAQLHDVALVRDDVKRGSFSFYVSDASQLRTDDFIALNTDKPTIDEYIAPIEANPQWRERTMHFRELHQVKSVEGQRVTLYEPIQTDIFSKHEWKVTTYQPLKEVGIEDIAFAGNFHENFNHAGGLLHSVGWSIVKFEDVANVWVRRARFSDANKPLAFLRSFMATADDVLFDGNSGHYSILVARSYGTFWSRLNVLSASYHGISFAAYSTNTVIYRTFFGAGGWDAHGNRPYGTLIDRSKANLRFNGHGGNPAGFPHHIHRFVLWNHFNSRESGRASFLDYVMPIAVGRDPKGAAITPLFAETMGYVESLDQLANPESLYEGQLEKRLGGLPDWVCEIKAAQMNDDANEQK